MRITLAGLLLLVLAVLPLAAQEGPDVTLVTLRSEALEGNLLGDPAEQQFAIYLPPGYHESEERYPVLYLLHGVGDTFGVWTGRHQIPALLDRLTGEGAIEPLIVVMPNGRNRRLGSFYLDSPVIGGWQTFIASELVGHVDANYRTIAAPASRAVAGHSMGGFGAINFGMRRPDVFGVVWAMSPCCLGFSEDIGWGNPYWFRAAGFSKPEDVQDAIRQGDLYPVAIIGMASALSPNPEQPLLVDLPIRAVGGELMPNEPVYTKWFDQFPTNRVAEARDALKGLGLLAIDYGIDDQFAHIPATTARFARELARYRIPHRLEVYDGDHRAVLPERLERIVLPAISAALDR
jgi:enterochelin esterase-like enzyme